MSNINSTDKQTILQLSGCAYSNLSNKLSDSLLYGRNTSKEYIQKLFLLNAYLEILQCYQIGQADNCLSETEIQDLIQNISTLSNICFAPLGTTYKTEITTPTAITKTIYWGSSSLTTLTDVQVQALQNSLSVTNASGTRYFNANNYKYYAYSTSFGTMTTFIDTLTSFNVPMDTPFTVVIGGDTYRVHRTYYPIVQPLNIAIS